MGYYSDLTIVDDEDNEYSVDVETYFEPADPSVGYMTSSHTIESVRYAGTTDDVPEELVDENEKWLMEQIDKAVEDAKMDAAVSKWEDRQDRADWYR